MSGVSYRQSAEFSSLEAAEDYGNFINSIATSELATVPTGENGTPKTIFAKQNGGDNVYYRIGNNDNLPGDQVTYVVRHMIRSPKDSTLADMYQTIPEVEAHLNNKLQELGGINATGHSR